MGNWGGFFIAVVMWIIANEYFGRQEKQLAHELELTKIKCTTQHMETH